MTLFLKWWYGPEAISSGLAFARGVFTHSPAIAGIQGARWCGHPGNRLLIAYFQREAERLKDAPLYSWEKRK